MGILIAAILFGVGFTFLAAQNTSITTLYVGAYKFSLPLFAIVLGSLLVGLFVAWFFSAIGWIFHSFSVGSRNVQIRNTEHHIDQLETRVKELEFENNRLREEKRTDEKREPVRGFFKHLNPGAHAI